MAGKREILPELERCRERALRLLAQRPHTVAQLNGKLLQKGFAPAEVGRIVEDFVRTGLLDDQRLAEDYCRAMLGSSSPVGRSRIAAKLRQYGIEAELVADVLENVWDKGGGEEELERAMAAGQAKMRLMRSPQPSRRDWEKLCRHLAAKGFSPDVCRQAAGCLLEAERFPG